MDEVYSRLGSWFLLLPLFLVFLLIPIFIRFSASVNFIITFLLGSSSYFRLRLLLIPLAIYTCTLSNKNIVYYICRTTLRVHNGGDLAKLDNRDIHEQKKKRNLFIVLRSLVYLGQAIRTWKQGCGSNVRLGRAKYFQVPRVDNSSSRDNRHPVVPHTLF